MKHLVMQVTLDTFKTLEENGVYIHYATEHYKDGSNLCFSIEFRNQGTQTGWYNDNHEFGDVTETMEKSLKLALWYLQCEKRIMLINSGYHNPEYITYLNDKGVFLEYLRGEFSIIEGEPIENGNYFPLNEEN
jgi:hypothetical protein